MRLNCIPKIANQCFVEWNRHANAIWLWRDRDWLSTRANIHRFILFCAKWKWKKKKIPSSHRAVTRRETKYGKVNVNWLGLCVLTLCQKQHIERINWNSTDRHTSIAPYRLCKQKNYIRHFFFWWLQCSKASSSLFYFVAQTLTLLYSFKFFIFNIRCLILWFDWNWKQKNPSHTQNHINDKNWILERKKTITHDCQWFKNQNERKNITFLCTIDGNNTFRFVS